MINEAPEPNAGREHFDAWREQMRQIWEANKPKSKRKRHIHGGENVVYSDAGQLNAVLMERVAREQEGEGKS